MKPRVRSAGALGLGQKVFIFDRKGFFNYFWDMGVSNAYLENCFDNTAQLMAFGAELSLRSGATVKGSSS